jgi:outer membrane protein assembly factor BamB
MIKELNVFPHNMAACSPLIVDDFIFITTANGVDENHTNIPSPEAPSFLTLSKKSGKLLWKSNAPGKDIMHGQWSNATFANIKGRKMVIFPGGDGWVYAYKPDTGDLLWKFDANPKDAKYDLGGKGTKSDFIGTPVVYDDKIYIGTGQDPEHFEGIGHFWCIDPTKNGDISPDLVTDGKADPPKTKANPNSGVIWHYGGKETAKHAKRDYVFGRTMSTACIVDDVIYIGELAGYLHCLDAKTGKKFWQFDLKSALWGSAYYVDGKVYIGNEDGDLFVFKHNPKQEVMDEVADAARAPDEKAANIVLKDVRAKVTKSHLLAKIAIDEPIRSTPVVANGVLYIMTEKTLYAIAEKK